MPIDASIISNLRPAPPIQFSDPLAQYGQALQLKNLMGQQTLQGLQTEGAQDSLQSSRKLRDLFANNPAPTEAQVMAVDPKTGLTYSKNRLDNRKTEAELQKLQLETETAKAKDARDMLATATDQASWTAMRQAGAAKGYQTLANAPEMYDPKYQLDHLQTAADFIRARESKPQTVNLGGKSAIIEGNRLAPGFENNVDLTHTATPGEVMTDTRTRSEGAANRGVQIRGQNMTDARSHDANAATQTNQSVNTEGKLRDDYNNASKDFVKVRDAHQRVLSSAKDPSAAGDLALIFNYMKVLDPGSTVREGEFATAQNSGSIPERVKAQYNKAIDGERLSDSIRNDFVDRSGRLYKAAETNQEKIENQYTEISKRSRADPRNVVAPQRVETTEAAKPTVSNTLPDPKQYDGKKMTDTSTNTKYVSRGGQWVRQ